MIKILAYQNKIQKILSVNNNRSNQTLTIALIFTIEAIIHEILEHFPRQISYHCLTMSKLC